MTRARLISFWACLAALLVVQFMCSPASAQQTAKVVSVCGTAGPYTAGTANYVTVDVNGNTCGTGGGSGSPSYVLPGAVTPGAGAASAIVTGGTALTVVTGPVNGCIITNGLTATDEGVTIEPLYVNAVTTATVQGNTTTFALQPGQSFNCVPGQTTNVSANAATTGHKFTVTKW